MLAGPPIAHAAAQTQTIDISADRQIMEASGKTHFKGHVSVAYQNVRIKSNQATIELNGAGEPGVATFRNQPTGKRVIPGVGEDDLKADTIRILLDTSTLQAQGDSVSHIRTIAANPITVHADAQEFDNRQKTVQASGHVRVDYQETKIYSPKAKFWMPQTGRTKKVVFTGGVRAQQHQSEIASQKLTFMPDTGNMLAEHQVRTKVVPKDPQASAGAKIRIDSDFQQYDKASQTMLASGNVRILYGGYRAFGPKATFKMNQGGVDRIILTGRSRIISQSREVEADKIVITTNPQHFDATGNVKSKFLSQSKPAPAPSSKAPASSGEDAAAASGTPGTVPPVTDAPSDDYLDD